MSNSSSKHQIAVVGTFDTKGEEHFFLKEAIEKRGLKALTVNIGTKAPSPVDVDIDFFQDVSSGPGQKTQSRDGAINFVLNSARRKLLFLYENSQIQGIISAGGGTGTYLGTSIMRSLPLGFPKFMVSTVASRDMSATVSTHDITMMHSVVDMLGVNSISAGILDRAAAAVCAMAGSRQTMTSTKERIALSLFGFITRAAEEIKVYLEDMGFEVVAFHANGTGGMALERLAAEGYFAGILDLATHELADDYLGGYCRGIGPQRLQNYLASDIPRLVVPGGLDCAVLEFTRDNVPHEFLGRKIFYYDFRSAIRLDEQETLFLARQLSDKLNAYPQRIQVLIPTQGWSEADQPGGCLHDPNLSEAFIRELKRYTNSRIPIRLVDAHINDSSFAELASRIMQDMLKS